RALRREANLKCLMLTLLILGCCAAVTWCRLAEVTRVMLPRHRLSSSGTPCEAGYLYIPVCFLALLYLVYLAECWHSRAQLSLQGHAQSLAEVLRFVQQMRAAEPVVWWKAVCYHYVRRKRQVTRYRHGEGYTATQVYYERVNTHAAASEFHAATCGVRDISKDLVLDPPAPVTRIRFSKGFAFSNVEAAADFEEQRARFFSEHERFDDYMEMREGLDLSGVPCFRELVVAYRDRKPWYFRPAVFWAASLLLLSWPVRLLQEYNTAHVHYQVTKLFGGNYDGGVPVPGGGGGGAATATDWLGGRLSHGSTMDSGEWDSCIRENCALIPSYSEALLMDEGGVDGDAADDADEQRSLVNARDADDE
ncbi:transmembrane protein 151B-like, partial [Thrips palmi]|uniref:Transmembrane protein 151B-like n=1 Tax=Thrips palmi TaxID=161013 RepID=A0A6P8YLX0_THRPL